MEQFQALLDRDIHIVFFHPFDIGFDIARCKGYGYWFQKGTKLYRYYNLYEAVLWYVYYKAKHISIDKHRKKQYGYWSNRNYFSRIPRHYRECDRKQGLHMTREAINEILKRNKGLPEDWDITKLNTLFTVGDIHSRTSAAADVRAQKAIQSNDAN